MLLWITSVKSINVNVPSNKPACCFYIELQWNT